MKYTSQIITLKCRLVIGREHSDVTQIITLTLVTLPAASSMSVVVRTRSLWLRMQFIYVGSAQTYALKMHTYVTF